ncbi:MAG: hypothetical protein V2A67_01695 [Bacteroidota bacterium]
MKYSRIYLTAVLLIIAFSCLGPEESGHLYKTDVTKKQDGRIVLTSGRLELVIGTQPGINPCSLRDRKSGRVYADGDYSWPDGGCPALTGKPLISEQNGIYSVTLKGKSGSLEIEQTFSARTDEPGVIAETIRLHNPGGELLEIPSFACGFTKKIHNGKDWLPGIADARICNVPYRRNTETGELSDYTLPELAARKDWYSIDRMFNRQESPIHGAEGWAWYRDGNTLLISKYNPDALEWSLLGMEQKNVPAGMEKYLRFGGTGRWKLGDPEGAARLAPGTGFSFGTTRYQVLDGDWREAYTAFRNFTESKGHRLPQNYNPPVHWNELYDNPLWWVGDNAENRQKFYQRKDMEAEADKAREFGCECLYLDPGWDDIFASTIWADDRLGAQSDFVRWLKEKYNMPLALHTPLAPWSDPAGYPAEACRMDKAGNRILELCCASSVYVKTKIARLRELCKNGAYFLMYDGSWFAGECWDPSHGHSLPLTHQEHLDAILRIQQEVHKEYPDVIIEQHDPMTGPGQPRYTPTFFMHAKPGAFDELWGYEYMIDNMNVIVADRRTVSLYYFNLAYSIPIYLHIDLRQDNTNAFVFWWFASTCRHLGVGGKHADPAVWEAQKNAMQIYLSLKRFYTQGVFYGLDETIHCHTLPDLGECVINCFNLEDKPSRKEVRFHLNEIGLAAGPVRIEGTPFQQTGDEIALDLAIPARGHLLLKVQAVTDKR